MMGTLDGFLGSTSTSVLPPPPHQAPYQSTLMAPPAAPTDPQHNVPGSGFPLGLDLVIPFDPTSVSITNSHKNTLALSKNSTDESELVGMLDGVENIDWGTLMGSKIGPGVDRQLEQKVGESFGVDFGHSTKDDDNTDSPKGVQDAEAAFGVGRVNNNHESAENPLLDGKMQNGEKSEQLEGVTFARVAQFAYGADLQEGSVTSMTGEKNQFNIASTSDGSTDRCHSAPLLAVLNNGVPAAQHGRGAGFLQPATSVAVDAGAGAPYSAPPPLAVLGSSAGSYSTLDLTAHVNAPPSAPIDGTYVHTGVGSARFNPCSFPVGSSVPSTPSDPASLRPAPKAGTPKKPRTFKKSPALVIRKSEPSSKKSKGAKAAAKHRRALRRNATKSKPVMPPTAQDILARREAAIKAGNRKNARLTEEERKILRRLRNRESAERCKAKKQKQLDSMQEQINDFQGGNQKLRKTAKSMTTYLVSLREEVGAARVERTCKAPRLLM